MTLESTKKTQNIITLCYKQLAISCYPTSRYYRDTKHSSTHSCDDGSSSASYKQGELYEGESLSAELVACSLLLPVVVDGSKLGGISIIVVVLVLLHEQFGKAPSCGVKQAVDSVACIALSSHNK